MKDHDDKSSHNESFSLTVAAREAVSAVVPQELEFFEDVTAAWVRRQLPYQRGSRRMASGAVGVGVDVTLVTELIYAAISGAAAEILGTVVTDAWQRRRWWRRARGVTTAPVQEIAVAGGDVERLREACRRHGVALGLTEAQADLLGDAVYGAIRHAEGNS